VASDRKERYHYALRVIAYNCYLAESFERPRLVGVKPRTVVGTLVRADYDAGGVRRSIRAALEHGHLISWRCPEGQRRYTPATADAYEAVAQALGAMYDPDDVGQAVPADRIGDLYARAAEAPETLALEGYWPGSGGRLHDGEGAISDD
jgi:hypothetical protein